MKTRAKRYNSALKHLPLTAASVDINGSVWSQKSTIWAGFKWHHAEFRQHSLIANDPNLSVPWAHIDDPDAPIAELARYRIRPRDHVAGWDFVRARNGNWVLQEPPHA